MQKENYKGYVIEAVPYQLDEDERWAIRIYISLDKGDRLEQREFSAANTFKDRAEAVGHCFNFGKQIIDGQIEGCSVDDL